MPRFRLYASLTGAEMIIERNGKSETIHVERPFFEDILLVKWLGEKYRIERRGILIRNGKIMKNGEFLGRFVEIPSIFTKILVYSKAKKEFEIEERDYFFGQEFIIKRNGKEIGKFRPLGIHVPILSFIGKGIEGEWSRLPGDAEELLVLALLGLGV